MKLTTGLTIAMYGFLAVVVLLCFVLQTWQSVVVAALTVGFVLGNLWVERHRKDEITKLNNDIKALTESLAALTGALSLGARRP